MKVSILKDECDECSIFKSLIIGGNFFLLVFYCFGTDDDCDGYVSYTTIFHLQISIGLKKWLVYETFLKKFIK